MTSKFDSATEDKISHIRKLMDDLPDEACAHVIDRIFSHCLRKLRSTSTLAEEIANALEAPGAIVFVLEDVHCYFESGHATDAADHHVRLLDEVSQAIKLVISDGPGGIH